VSTPKALEKLGLPDLKVQAKLRGIKNYGKYKKAELLRRVTNVKARRKYLRIINVDDDDLLAGSSCGDVTGSEGEEDMNPPTPAGQLARRRVSFRSDVGHSGEPDQKNRRIR
jgi:hypothetical protein